MSSRADQEIASMLAVLRDDIAAAKAKLKTGSAITLADLDELDASVLIIAAEVTDPPGRDGTEPQP